MIPYGRQDINQADIDAVVDVLRSDFLTQGPAVPAFEDAVASYCKVRNAVAVNSATSALHIACLALGVGQGDLVWTTPITFVASANCALYCGADVDFVDIDLRSYNMCPLRLAEKLAEAKTANRLPKVVIPVHLSGQSCDMEAIHTLSLQYGFKIIEDASHAIGGRYKGEPVGTCRYSDITVFSFHPVKIITTAEGGMAVTNNAHLDQRMRLLRSHGITRDEEEMTHPSHGPWYYQQVELGLNYRLTDLQAVLGLSQMKRLDNFVSARHMLVDRYNRLLQDLPVITPWQLPESHSGLHLYVIRLNLAKISNSHLNIFEYLRGKGIGVNLHYIPVYRHPYYTKLGFVKGYCPNSELYYDSAISLPLYPGLSEAMQDSVVTALNTALN